MRARRVLPCVVVVAAILAGPPAAGVPATPHRPAERPRWMQRIDTVVGDLPVSVVIGYQGTDLYRHLHWVRRAPASNEKLLLSMALLDRFPTSRRIPTQVLSAHRPSGGIVHGDLWIEGHGDPDLQPKDMAALAAGLKVRGIRRIAGRVMGSTAGFERDWFAPGWKDDFPADEVARPTALTFRGNLDRHGVHVSDPERRAAIGLAAHLKAVGIKVKGTPGMGTPPDQLFRLASTRSRMLLGLIHRMDVWSRNFYAEVLGKYLGTRFSGKPGTIARTGWAIRAYARAHGVPDDIAYDGSGLSYANRITAQDIVDLLQDADAQPWGATLRDALAHGGQGTLKDRLSRVPLRAKTGTLIDVSALSGWVWLDREDAWAEFSILSGGISKRRSVAIENAIVQVVNANAAPPAP